ncbi:hypothetical protein EDB81DRAFT_754377 [Dactylonectria macrodidyma]|uniref:Uncharacterized protein n=1 Tax=Dactylonectria macrodidyma TaxID=307937 RepID=A0A9P9FK62_9HYPO|nr:hypothetical protein EDB81DRAFT_754377 [Dactylonectria macrodidyma]
MEKVGIILLVLFLFIIVIGPLTCFKLSREDKPKIYNPQPNQIEDARSKLRTYTTCSTVVQRTSGGCNDDVEAIAPPSEFGECAKFIAWSTTRAIELWANNGLADRPTD